MRCPRCDGEERVLAAPPGLAIPPALAERSRLRVMRDPLILPGRIYDVLCPDCRGKGKVRAHVGEPGV
jgi:hypothetical protein